MIVPMPKLSTSSYQFTFTVLGVCLLLICYLIIDGNNRSRWPYLISAEKEDRQFETVIQISLLDLENNMFKYSIGYIDTGYNTLSNYDSLCINQVTTNLRELSYTSWSYRQGQLTKGVGSSPNDSRLSMTVPLPKELCKSSQTIPKVEGNRRSPGDSVTINMEDNGPIVFYRYFYPYDEINIEMSIVFLGVYQKGDIKGDIKVVPNVDWQVDMPGWELANTKVTETDKESKIEFKLQRPYTFRVLTPLLILCSLIFIFSIPFIHDLGSLAQVATGLVVGLWGLRQIVLLPEIKWSTVLDPIFVLLYTLLAVSILLRLFLVNPPMINLSSNEVEKTIPLRRKLKLIIRAENHQTQKKSRGAKDSVSLRRKKSYQRDKHTKVVLQAA